MTFMSRKGGDKGTLPASPPNRHRARKDLPKRIVKNPIMRRNRSAGERTVHDWAKALRGRDKMQLLIWRAFPNHPRFNT